ncbi:MAG: phosphoribosylamine--glycine ligase, partial [Anaerolineae bacterium]
MKVLVVGSGGREHTIGWKLAQSPLVAEVIFAPGNGGTNWAGGNGVASARNVSVGVDEHDRLMELVQTENIDLTFVGPEAPLAAGIVDKFQAAGHKIFGPSQKAARLESSKAFSKAFMADEGIPTAEYASFSDLDRALGYLQTINHQVVVKASGLAAGKGVIVCDNHTQAEQALTDMMSDQRFGEAGSSVVIEERLTGPELSLLVLCDGKTAKPLIHSRDHKRAFDNDEGPNTGGMGAYAPVPEVGPELIAEVMEKVVAPVMTGMAEWDTPYVGVLYVGLMLTPKGIKVIEFNCRLGDPETQVVLPMLKSDLAELVLACVDGKLAEKTIENHAGFCAAVVMAAPGYPNSYPKGLAIGGVEEANQLKDVTVFHAGTNINEGQLVSSGGRVLA